MEEIKKDHAVRKHYSFAKEHVTLAFALRVDTKKELEIFRELMEQAIIEVEKDAEEVKE